MNFFARSVVAGLAMTVLPPQRATKNPIRTMEFVRMIYPYEAERATRNRES